MIISGVISETMGRLPAMKMTEPYSPTARAKARGRSPWFTPALFSFLEELRLHNDRDWFERNRERYLRDVRDPMLRFVAGAAPVLKGIAPRLVADPRPVGGSLFRIHRDTRFSKDKTPYKTNVAASFRHEAGRDVCDSSPALSRRVRSPRCHFVVPQASPPVFPPRPSRRGNPHLAGPPGQPLSGAPGGQKKRRVAEATLLDSLRPPPVGAAVAYLRMSFLSLFWQASSADWQAVSGWMTGGGGGAIGRRWSPPQT